MGAFIVGAALFVATLGLTFMVALARGMSTTGLYGPSPVAVFVAGCAIWLLVVSSHWFPIIGW